MTRKIMQTALLTVCFVVLLSQYAAAGIKGSLHDFSTTGNSGFSGHYYVGSVSSSNRVDQVCVFCHTPHKASTGAISDPSYGVGYLWNRVVTQSTGGYKLYTSSTSSFVSKAPIGLSLMCLSCHDGVTSMAVGSLLNAPGSGNPAVVVDTAMFESGSGAIGDLYYTGSSMGEGANLGGLTGPGPYANEIVDLSNDHPVSFPWSDTNGIQGIKKPAADSPLRLFGGAGVDRMECSTCHDVHNDTNKPFLVMPNNDSGMCLTCHDK